MICFYNYINKKIGVNNSHCNKVEFQPYKGQHVKTTSISICDFVINQFGFCN